jgi:hypothetical protein
MLHAMTQRAYPWLVAALLFASGVQAQPLRIDASAERMRIDGALSEWKGAHFATLGTGADASLRYALATADDGLYVGVEINDDKLVRKASPGPGQDALVLTLAMITRGSSLSASEVWLHPGQAGKSKAVAAIGAKGAALKPSNTIKVVEGPNKNGAGYVIEAFIPWKVVPGADIWEQGRGALRFEDADQGKPDVLSTASGAQLEDLPRLIAGDGQQDFFGAFAKEKNLIGIEPRFDFRGQVFGDKRLERVVLIDRYMLVYGPGYKDGNGFGFVQLPIGMGGGLKSAVLRDFNGDGLDEIAIVTRQKNELGAREVWQAYSLDGTNPKPLFGFELRKETRGGFVESTLAIEKDRAGVTTFILSRGKSSGLDEKTFQETRATDLEPILLPWQEVSSRRYRYEKGRLSKLDEQRDASRASAEATASAPPAPAANEEVQVEPTLEAVLALFKEQRGVPANARPSRHLRGNVLGKKSEEELFVFGSTLVIVGPEVGAGGGYIAYGLPVTDPSDLRHVGLADVTGDKRAEIFVRVRQPLGGAEGVSRGVMLVHQVDEQGRVTRLLSSEVFRFQGDKRIANEVSTRGGTLTVSPGMAKGWSATDYPFSDDEIGGSARLLLPWQDKPLRYKFARGALVPE